MYLITGTGQNTRNENPQKCGEKSTNVVAFEQLPEGAGWAWTPCRGCEGSAQQGRWLHDLVAGWINFNLIFFCLIG